METYSRTGPRVYAQSVAHAAEPYATGNAVRHLKDNMTVIFDEAIAEHIRADRENGTSTLRDEGFTAIADLVGL
jgi:hypothetical protein